MTEKNPQWGAYTWYLIHSLAEHIKDEHFQEERKNILAIIQQICGTLPCPSCQQHAHTYLAKYPIHRIPNKEYLKKYLFVFHNAVSSRGNKTQFDETILDRYKSVNIKLLLKNWNIVFSGGSHVRQDDFMLKTNIQRVKQKVNSYISKNIHKFTFRL